MESTIQLSLESFEQFKEGNFKSAEQILQKIKQQSKRPISRIEENILLCEYLQNRDSNKSVYQQKLQELLSNLRYLDSNQSKKVSPGSKSNKGEEQEVPAEFEDDSILKYNYVVILYFEGQYRQAMRIINELLDKINHMHSYISQKVVLLGLDLAIQKKNEPLINKILNIIDTQKLIFQKDENTEKQHQQNGSENSESGNDGSKQSKKLYCSVGFGGEIYGLGQPMALCKLEFYFILNILKTQLFLLYNDFKQAKKTLKLSNKSVQKFIQILQSSQNESNDNNNNKKSQLDTSCKYSNQMVPYLQKQCLTIFKYTKAYLAFKEQNYMKAIKQLSPNSTVVTDFNSLPGDFYNHQSNFQIYQLNNLGCIHLKMKKYNIATNYFLKGIHVCKQQSHTIKKLGQQEQQIIYLNKPRIQTLLHNLGLSFLHTHKYQEAYSCLSKITQQIPENENLWYRIGSGLVQIYHQKLKTAYNSNPNGGAYKEILDNYPLRFSSLPDDIRKINYGKIRKDSDPQQQQNEGHNVNMKQSSSQSQQNTQQLVQNYQSFKRYVLYQKRGSEASSQNIQDKKSSNQQQQQCYEELLTMAINCFRNCLMLCYDRVKKIESNFSISIGIDNEIIEKLNKNEEIVSENVNIQQEKIAFNNEEKSEQIQKMLASCYTQMSYLHVCTKEWNNAITCAVKASSLQAYLSDEDKISNSMYQMESYIEMGNLKQATKIQSNLLVQNTNSMINQQVQNCQNGVGPDGAYFCDMTSKTICTINFALLFIKLGDLDKAQNSINAVLQNLDINPNAIGANLPLPILNLFIYINLKNHNAGAALQFIRRRRYLNLIALNNNKTMLEVTK